MEEPSEMPEASSARKSVPLWLTLLGASLLAAGVIFISIATDTDLSGLFKIFALFSR